MVNSGNFANVALAPGLTNILHPSLIIPHFLGLSEAASEQMFSAEPAYTEVNPGADEVLDCQVDNIGGECRWQKDGKVSECGTYNKL